MQLQGHFETSFLSSNQIPCCCWQEPTSFNDVFLAQVTTDMTPSAYPATDSYKEVIIIPR